MAYTKIAAIGEYTTTNTVGNPCNVQTLDNIVMLCDDMDVVNYTSGDVLLTLSDSSMFPTSELTIPVFITDLSQTPNYFFITPLRVNSSGELYLNVNLSNATIHLNGICFHVNSTYYNQTIGNTDPSLFTSPLNGV